MPWYDDGTDLGEDGSPSIRRLGQELLVLQALDEGKEYITYTFYGR